MYALAPVIAWLVAGTLKYLINSLRFGNGRERIGNGGFPSNHTTMITTPVMLTGLQTGFDSPVFGLGVAVLCIVVMDATGLRRYVGYHAERINQLQQAGPKLRESIGHKWAEIGGGLVLGTLLAFLLSAFAF